MEDYKQKYEEAIARMNKWVEGSEIIEPKEVAEFVFPELKESEDERIRKEIIEYLEQSQFGEEHYQIDDDIVRGYIAWLEKQGEQKLYVNDNAKEMFIKALERVEEQNSKGYKLTDCDKNSWWEDFKAYTSCTIEQKPTDKIEPKFKVGDWIIGNTIYKVLCVIDDEYRLSLNIDDSIVCAKIKSIDKRFHLWTIQDAKDGDVLANKYGAIFINAGNSKGRGTLDCYCYLSVQNEFCIEEHKTGSWFYKDDIKPATKEQRDLLFQKMKEAGYEWDSEKKELRKIEQKTEINDNVLSRFAFYQYDNDTIYLSSVFVEECNRKRGYGSKILKAAEEVAKTLGISKIRLKVERNTWMEEWYKKNGYEYLSPDGEYNWLEKQVEQKPIDKVEPKFKVGDVMRTLQEAANGMTDGMPVIFYIDDEYYHCTNELILIKDQDNYEYPPMNKR